MSQEFAGNPKKISRFKSSSRDRSITQTKNGEASSMTQINKELDITQTLLKFLSSYFKPGPKINEFHNFLKTQAKTLFNMTTSFSYSQIIKLADFLNINPKDLNVNIHLLIQTVMEAKDWLVHLKFLVVLTNLLRRLDQKLAPEATQYLLSNLPKPAKTHEGLKNQTQSTSLLVYENIFQNLRTYLLRVCQNFQAYQSLWKQTKSCEYVPSYLLFKVINICSYLLASRNTFNILFKELTEVELFLVLFRTITQELNAWYQYFCAKLSIMIGNVKELEKDQLDNLNQLTFEAEKLYIKTNLFMKLAQIYKIPMKINQIKPFKAPIEFKLYLERVHKNENQHNRKRSQDYLNNIIKIESYERIFMEDEFDSSLIVPRKKPNPKHQMNKSLIVQRYFQDDFI